MKSIKDMLLDIEKIEGRVFHLELYSDNSGCVADDDDGTVLFVFDALEELYNVYYIWKMYKKNGSTWNGLKKDSRVIGVIK